MDAPQHIANEAPFDMGAEVRLLVGDDRRMAHVARAAYFAGLAWTLAQDVQSVEYLDASHTKRKLRDGDRL